LLAAMAGGGGGGGGGGEFGGYLEDAAGMADTGGEDDAERDIRINIPQENTPESGNILSTGIRWLFGA